MNRYTILVAEEDPATRAFLADNLTADGYGVASAASAREALHALASARPHVVIVDLDGRTLELVDAVRRGDRPACLDPDTPLLVLSDRSDALSRVRVFERGGDDVVAKPFSYPELRGRIGALLRRSHRTDTRQVTRIGGLTIDAAAREVRVDGQRVELSKIEFALLRALAAQPTRVFTKDELLRDVWGYKSPGTTRTLDSHACRLRTKLNGGTGRYIINRWGVGYALTTPAEASTPPRA